MLDSVGAGLIWHIGDVGTAGIVGFRDVGVVEWAGGLAVEWCGSEGVVGGLVVRGVVVGRIVDVDVHVGVAVGKTAFFGARTVRGVECWWAGGRDGFGADETGPVVEGGGGAVVVVIVHGG